MLGRRRFVPDDDDDDDGFDGSSANPGSSLAGVRRDPQEAEARARSRSRQLDNLGEACGYQVDLSLAAGHPDGSFDAVFRRLGEGDLPPLSWAVVQLSRP